VVRVVLDNIVIDMAAFGPALRPCLNVSGRHFLPSLAPLRP
jgi:hypothetical protein